MRHFLTLLACLLLISPALADRYACPPTPEDEMGPFYRPGAPVRSSIGQGYVTYGAVRSASDCSPIAEARIEFWMTNNEGRYDQDRRATFFSGEQGAYRFESNVPALYTGRPPHIHIRVSAAGFHTLVTQHYPEEGAVKGEFDLVLKPEHPD
jgi:protocatechuate 3,4-dioxygenase beta subunit